MSPFTAYIDIPSRSAHPRGSSERSRWIFGAPRSWIIAHNPADVRRAIDTAHQAALHGAWCVGYVRYEAAPAFDRALQTHPTDGPLVCFAVFNADEVRPATAESALDTVDAPYCSANWRDPLSAAEFERRIDEIHELIRNGEVYQINFTTLLHSQLSGDPHAYFHALRRSQPGGYCVHFDARGATPHAHGERILSVSPELFFDWHNGTLTTQPMKGTAARGIDEASDKLAAQALLASEKERAENLMIVDLLRNDLARVARTGSVEVPTLFELHALPTVWQMTSTVRATTREGTHLSDIFAALFPCGSITGAPKVRAMHHIARLEPGPRGVYCGAVGVLRPGGHATFNVPIRTVVLRDEPQPASLRCGIGSGITLDARADHEAIEWRHKQRFLERAARPFKLLESLRLEDGRLWLLDEHLDRLNRSARELNHPLDLDAVRHALTDAAHRHPQGCFKIRLLTWPSKRIEIDVQPLPPVSVPLRVNLARHPMATRDDAPNSPINDFIRHKTTRREVYAAHVAQDGAFDTLLWNLNGELTEFTIGNLALRLQDRWLTPPLSAGLLGGTYRQRLLARGDLHEARLSPADVLRADAAAFFNSVRGWLPIDLKRLQDQARAARAASSGPWGVTS